MTRPVQAGQPVRFEIGDVIGKGTYGIVYRGWYQGREVAVKKVDLDRVDVQDVTREMEGMCQLHHPNVLKLHCSMVQDNFRYLILELCGGTLDDWFAGKLQWPAVDQVGALHQLADGLQHIHSARLVHRDIKPANILIKMVGSHVWLKISDFGLCKRTTPNGSFSLSGIKGTTIYLAPEMLTFYQDGRALYVDPERQMRARATVKSDVFALGCVFYQLLTKGTHPFGQGFLVAANIIGGRCDLSKLDGSHFALEMIGAMIAVRPEHRPDAKQIVSFLVPRLPIKPGPEIKKFALGAISTIVEPAEDQVAGGKPSRVILMARRVKKAGAMVMSSFGHLVTGRGHRQSTSRPKATEKRKLSKEQDQLADSLSNLSIQAAKRRKQN